MKNKSEIASLIPVVILSIFFLFSGAFAVDKEVTIQDSDMLRVLMVTGGGWHDYDVQKGILEEGLAERIGHIEFTIDHEIGGDASAKLTIQQNSDWASQYDLVIYNNCQSGVDDVNHIESIIGAHVENQLPAVMLHCAMHSFRGDTMKWFEFVGARSHRHESHQAFTVESVRTDHPIMANFPRTWRTPHGELYEIVELFSGSTPLARAYGIDTDLYHDVVWTHEYEGVKIFSSTLGHHNVTMGHDVNLNLVAAGLLWAAGKLNEDGTASDGYESDRGLGWVSIWDGESLDGWRASENSESFQVEDGKIVVDGPRSHLFYAGPIAGGDFVNFEFKSDVYTYPQANSGIYFHSRYQHIGLPQVGHEAQINATHIGPSKTGSLYAVNDVFDAPHEDHEWFNYYISVDGKDILFKVNGDEVMSFTEPDDRDGTISLDRGTISLQAHDPNSRIYYKNLYIRTWPD